MKTNAYTFYNDNYKTLTFDENAAIHKKITAQSCMEKCDAYAACKGIIVLNNGCQLVKQQGGSASCNNATEYIMKMINNEKLSNEDMVRLKSFEKDKKELCVRFDKMYSNGKGPTAPNEGIKLMYPNKMTYEIVGENLKLYPTRMESANKHASTCTANQQCGGYIYKPNVQQQSAPN